MRLIVSLAASAAILAALAAPAHAGALHDYAIKVDRSELQSVRGIERTHASIERQVRRFCETSGNRSLRQRRDEQTCQAEIMAEVIAEIDYQPLTAYHRTGQVQMYTAN